MKQRCNVNAIIYCRVSTKEQAESGFSLPAQEKQCKEFALKNDYKVDKIFIEKGESAKTQNRTQLIKMIEYAVKNQKIITTLIIWKFDRLARNLSDQTELVKRFSKLKIWTLSVTEDNSNNAQGKLMRNIYGSFSQYENDLKSERTIEGMKQATREGFWCFPAPLGYRFSKNELSKSILEPTEDSKYIKYAFELAEKGIYTQVEIVQKLKVRGFKKVKSSNHLKRILTNQLYAGMIKVKWFDESFKGKHESLVTKTTYHKVQLILNNKSTNCVPHIVHNPDFPLRGFVRCSECEGKFTGGWSKGRSKKYPYYNCRSKGCSNSVRKEIIENQFIGLVKGLEPNKKVLNLFEQILIDVWKEQQKDNINEKKRLKRGIDNLYVELMRIEQLLVNKIFKPEVYKRNHQRVENEIFLKKSQLEEMNSKGNDVSNMVNYCKYLLSNLSELWIKADINLKQRLQKLIFPEGILFDGDKVRTAVTNTIFGCLQNINTQKVKMVSRRGIEPLMQE
jgi:site-specific DNA recombinase